VLLRKAGHSFRTIGRMIGRAHTSVQFRITQHEIENATHREDDP
jgi:hypothetical protein